MSEPIGGIPGSINNIRWEIPSLTFSSDAKLGAVEFDDEHNEATEVRYLSSTGNIGETKALGPDLLNDPSVGENFNLN